MDFSLIKPIISTTRIPRLYELLDRSKLKYKLVAEFTHHFHDVQTRSPTKNISKEQYIHSYLDYVLKDFDFSLSFQTKLIIVYDETSDIEIITSLHTWLIKQCCDIRNIILICIDRGIKKWYLNYLNLYGYGDWGMQVIEMPPLLSDQRRWTNNAPFLESKKHKKYFSVYGGSYSKIERDFLIANLLELKEYGLIDYLGGFTQPTSNLFNEFEGLIHFTNATLLEKVIKNTNIVFEKTGDPNELLGSADVTITKESKIIFFNVLRETYMDVPWTCFTEKSISPFLHQQIPIPIAGVGSVSEIEKMGFIFDYTIFDYNQYQNIVNYSDRMLKMIGLLVDFIKQHTLSDLDDYYVQNNKLYLHNFEILTKGYVASKTEHFFIEELNNLE